MCFIQTKLPVQMLELTTPSLSFQLQKLNFKFVKGLESLLAMDLITCGMENLMLLKTKTEPVYQHPALSNKPKECQSICKPSDTRSTTCVRRETEIETLNPCS